MSCCGGAEEVKGGCNCAATGQCTCAGNCQCGHLAIRKPAPHFETGAYYNGIKTIKLSDYKGKYVVLFFYPLDFTFVCPTEIIQFSDRAKEFRDIGCEVVACSIDSQFSHMEYTQKSVENGGVGQLQFPLVADFSHMISTAYGALCTDGDDYGLSYRATVIIDKKGIVRHFSINDLPVGRNPDEYIRLVKAFQFTDAHGEVCPANWKPGEKSMKPDVKSDQYKNVIKEHGEKKKA